MMMMMMMMMMKLSLQCHDVYSIPQICFFFKIAICVTFTKLSNDLQISKVRDYTAVSFECLQEFVQFFCIFQFKEPLICGVIHVSVVIVG